MKTIWKYSFTITDDVQMKVIPKNAIFVHTDMQYGQLVAWFIVDYDNSDKPQGSRYFKIVGTGHPISGNFTYLGTAKDEAFSICYIWHLLEVSEESIIYHLTEESK